MSGKPDADLLRTPEGEWIGPQELQRMLASEGYSAGGREQFLKAILTELTRVDPDETENPETRRKLLAEVRRNLSDLQGDNDQAPLSDDTL